MNQINKFVSLFVMIFLNDETLNGILLQKHIMSNVAVFYSVALKYSTLVLKKDTDNNITFRFIDDDLLPCQKIDYSGFISGIIGPLSRILSVRTIGDIVENGYDPKVYTKLLKLTKGDEKIHSTITALHKQLSAYTPVAQKYKTDIPDEFLDPLTCEPIVTPVLLPNMSDCENESVMERSGLVRYIMDKSENPFTREKLTVEDLDSFNNTESVKEKLADFLNRFNKWKNENAA